MKAVNFFSILKSECIYRFKPKTFAEANEMIDRYLYFYNHKRIQLKTEVAPLTLRHSALYLIFPTQGLFRILRCKLRYRLLQFYCGDNKTLLIS